MLPDPANEPLKSRIVALDEGNQQRNDRLLSF